MSEKTVQAGVYLDVFTTERDQAEPKDSREWGVTPQELGERAWDEIKRWVADGYLPVIQVTMPDGLVHVVDLEVQE